MPTITLIAAVSADGFISRGSGVPWHLPADIAHFRHATAGKWLLLGRRTYDEMRGWFDDSHTPLVLTHAPELKGPGRAVSSVAEALALAASQTELMVCGGGQIYAAMMPHATCLWITRVQTQLSGGVAFPVVDSDVWEVVSTQPRSADREHEFAMEFVCLQRRR